MITALLFIILAVLVFVFYFSKYKDWLQPNMVFLIIWLLTSGWSSIDYDDFMNPWSIGMYFTTIISAISFWMGSLLIYISKKSSNYRKSPIILPKIYSQLVIIIYTICLASFLYEWWIQGAVITLTLTPDESSFDSKVDAVQGVPVIHYGTVFLPYVSILLVFRYFNGGASLLKTVLLFIPLIIIAVVVKASRGDLLIYIFSLLFLYSRYRQIKIRQLLFFIALFLLSIVGLMLLRLNEASVVYNMTGNPYISVFYSYIATCYANLNDLINLRLDPQLEGGLTFAPLWTLTGFKSDFNPLMIEQIGVFNARTYLYGFFHDYGYPGIIIFPFIIGLVVSIIYHRSYSSSPYWILLLASLQKAIFVPFFSNYFTGQFITMFPYILITILILTFISATKNKCYANNNTL